MRYEEILRRLHEAGVRFLVVGGLAVNLHGVPRLTYDLDIIASWDEDNLKRLIDELLKLGYKPRLPVDPFDLLHPELRRIWIEKKNLKSFTFFNDRDPTCEVDLLLVYDKGFDSLHSRRRVIGVEGYEIPVVSLNDLIEMKRVTGRKQDLSDIEALEITRDA